MKRDISWSTTLLLFVIALATPVLAFAQAKSLPMGESNAGQVRVTVIPQDLSAAADTWRFEVRLNTHVTEISQDMVAVASLSAGNGVVEKPTAWEGDPPGGHHRKGMLIFKAINPMPTTVTLHIREVGGIADRVFTWNLKSP